MNNEDLKKLLKQEISFDIKDCLTNIKNTNVDIEPCSITAHRSYRPLIKYSVYGFLGLSVLSLSSYQAYRYVTPNTFVSIEVSNKIDDMSNNLVSDTSFTVHLELNDFNQVIDLNAPQNQHIEEMNINHMNYKEALPMVVNYLSDITNNSKTITVTVLTNDYNKCYNIENNIRSFKFTSNFNNLYINDFRYDENSDVSYGVQRAIYEITSKTDKYDPEFLKTKSLKELVDIMKSL